MDVFVLPLIMSFFLYLGFIWLHTYIFHTVSIFDNIKLFCQHEWALCMFGTIVFVWNLLFLTLVESLQLFLCLMFTWKNIFLFRFSISMALCWKCFIVYLCICLFGFIISIFTSKDKIIMYFPTKKSPNVLLPARQNVCILSFK